MMIRKIIALAVLTICYSITVSGQSFTILKDSVKEMGEAGKTISPKTQIVNQSGRQIEFRWVRINTNIPQSWQRTGVCDKNKCYINADSATFKLAGNDSGLMKINFYAYDKDFNEEFGTGNIQIMVYPVGESRAEAKTMYFEGETNTSSGIGDKTKKQSEARLFPNPVISQLNIEFSKEVNETATIFNVLGKPIKDIDIAGKKQIQISVEDLPNGTYFLKYQSRNNKTITKTFSKK